MSAKDDVSELRQLLEPLAARKAARNAGPDLRAELNSVARTIEELAGTTEKPEKKALMRYDLTVHRLIYKAAGNRHLEDSLIRYDNLATRIWCLVIDQLPRLTEHVHEHFELLQAVIDGNEDRASGLARHHIEGFEVAVRSALFAA